MTSYTQVPFHPTPVTSGTFTTGSTGSSLPHVVQHIWNPTTTTIGSPSPGKITMPLSQTKTIIDGKIVVTVDDKQVELGELLNSIMKRLAILAPSDHLHEKYPALQEAYEAYRIIEALCLSGEASEKERE